MAERTSLPQPAPASGAGRPGPRRRYEPLHLNVLVVGEAGMGKTSFIRCLAQEQQQQQVEIQAQARSKTRVELPLPDRKAHDGCANSCLYAW